MIREKMVEKEALPEGKGGRDQEDEGFSGSDDKGSRAGNDDRYLYLLYYAKAIHCILCYHILLLAIMYIYIYIYFTSIYMYI
jgi:hypothetical protein